MSANLSLSQKRKAPPTPVVDISGDDDHPSPKRRPPPLQSPQATEWRSRLSDTVHRKEVENSLNAEMGPIAGRRMLSRSSSSNNERALLESVRRRQHPQRGSSSARLGRSTSDSISSPLRNLPRQGRGEMRRSPRDELHGSQDSMTGGKREARTRTQRTEYGIHISKFGETRDEYLLPGESRLGSRQIQDLYRFFDRGESDGIYLVSHREQKEFPDWEERVKRINADRRKEMKIDLETRELKYENQMEMLEISARKRKRGLVIDSSDTEPDDLPAPDSPHSTHSAHSSQSSYNSQSSRSSQASSNPVLRRKRKHIQLNRHFLVDDQNNVTDLTDDQPRRQVGSKTGSPATFMPSGVIPVMATTVADIPPPRKQYPKRERRRPPSHGDVLGEKDCRAFVDPYLMETGEVQKDDDADWDNAGDGFDDSQGEQPAGKPTRARKRVKNNKEEEGGKEEEMVECPLCLKKKPKSKIQGHASECMGGGGSPPPKKPDYPKTLMPKGMRIQKRQSSMKDYVGK